MLCEASGSAGRGRRACPVAWTLATSRAAGVGSELDRIIEEAGLEDPPDEVVIAEPARRPRRPPAREEDLAAGLVQLLGDLAARLAAADDQHRPGGQLARIAVVLDVDLEQVRRERRRAGRPVRALVGAGAQDHRPRLERPVRGLEQRSRRPAAARAQ